MIHDVLPLIHDAKLRRPIPRLIQRVLIPAVDSYMPKRNPRHFLKFPIDPAPIHCPHNDCEVLAIRFFVKQLREHFLRALQPSDSQRCQCTVASAS
jgi:hypothetical protein